MNILKIIASLIIGFLIALGCVSFGWNVLLIKRQFSLRNERNTFLAQNKQYEKDLIDFNENLTKAKEIIKDLLRVLPKENIEGVYEITEEAEQFIRKNT